MRLTKCIWLGLLALTIGLHPALATDYSGAYDVGGGAMDFASPQAALTELATSGNQMTGSVTLNVYTGIYTGVVTIPAITGLGSANPLVMQNAVGNAPVIENPSGHGIYVSSADYVTIRGFEIRACGQSAIRAESAVDSVTYLVIENNYLHPDGSASVLYMQRAADCLVSANRIEVTGMTNNNREAIQIRFSDRNRFVNNMIASAYAPYASGVVVERDCDLHEWYFNSICGTDAYGVFYESPQSGRLHRNVFFNNIFYNGGSGTTGKSAFMLNGVSSYLADMDSDHNLVFVLGVDSAEFVISGQGMSLEAWRDSSGFDEHTFRFNPGFASSQTPFDLHLPTDVVTLADSAGTPIAGLTTDFDGEARNATHPDVGADEASFPYNIIVLGYRPVTPNQGRFWDVFTYKVDYLHRDGLAPTSAWLHVDGQPFAPMDIPPGNYAQGVTLSTEGMLEPGMHTYHFEVAENANTARLPSTGAYDGPEIVTAMGGSYDVGGGNMDFATPAEAVQTLNIAGMSEAIVFNVFSGTYTEGVVLTDTLPGNGARSLVFQNAPGETPVMNVIGGTAFSLIGADSIIIRGFEIRDCNTGISINRRNLGGDPPVFDYPYDNRIEGNHIIQPSTGIPSAIRVRRAEYTDVVGNLIEGGWAGIHVNESGSANRFYNNMILGPTYGAIDGGSVETHWLFNTIYVTGNYSACMMISGTGSAESVLNNVMYAGGTESSFCYFIGPLEYTAPPDISDYNDLYAPDGCVFGARNMEGFDVPPYYCTLEDWQNASGLDMNSVSGDPGFVSETDLHIQPTAGLLESRGSNIPWILDDFDGDGRREIPDIGADEYEHTPPPETVADLTAYPVDGDIRLMWSPTAGAASYKIYGAPTATFDSAELLHTTTETTYLHPDTSETYFFYVIATDETP